MAKSPRRSPPKSRVLTAEPLSTMPSGNNESGTQGEWGDRREEILSTAARLFSEKGVATTTVREIGESVGLLSQSLYHYFPSKEEIVHGILQRYLDDLLMANKAVDQNLGPYDAMQALIAATFDVITAHRAACLIYISESRYLSSLGTFDYIAKGADSLQAIWHSTIKRGQKERVFDPDVDPWLFCRYCMGAIFSLVWWYPPAPEYDSAAMIEQISGVFLHGLATEAVHLPIERHAIPHVVPIPPPVLTRDRRK